VFSGVARDKSMYRHHYSGGSGDMPPLKKMISYIAAAAF